MIDYSKFKVEDFITDDSFLLWVKGTSPEHTAFWEFWMEAHPEKSETVAQARRILLGLKNQPTSINDDEISLEVEKIIGLVENRPLNNTNPFWFTWTRIAAAIVLVGSLSWWVWPGNRNSEFKPQLTEVNFVPGAAKSAQIEVANNTASDYTATLPDGSTVQLKKGSKVSFAEKFSGAKREVYLSGEGFFEVVKKPDQPFYVYANNLVTRVLGTSFTVKAYSKDQKVVVAVKTGKVMVFPMSELRKSEKIANYQVQSLYLSPNQQATFERQNERFNKALVEQPAILTETEETPDFNFESSPISEVFAKLKTAYGVDIVYDADVMKHCSVTAPLGNESLFVKLNIICKTIGARYEIVETKVVVSSRGCQ